MHSTAAAIARIHSWHLFTNGPKGKQVSIVEAFSVASHTDCHGKAQETKNKIGLDGRGKRINGIAQDNKMPICQGETEFSALLQSGHNHKSGKCLQDLWCRQDVGFISAIHLQNRISQINVGVSQG